MTTDATFEATSDAPREPATPAGGGWLRSFFLQPFRPQTFGRAIYNVLAFPLGLLYFVALTVGTAVGVPLTLVWIGFLVLAITGALLLGFVSFERELAKLLLGAQLAPMSPQPTGPLTITQRVGSFLGNPVTWKGAAFLILKFPLGIATFVTVVTSFAISAVFLVGPFFYRQQWIGVDFGVFLWNVDTLPEAILMSFVGFGVLFLTLHLMNAVGIGWRWLAEGMLGSESHRPADCAPAPPPMALAVPAG